MYLQILLVLLAYLTLGIHTAEWMGIYRSEKFPGKCAITSDLILNEGAIIKDPTHECRQIVCGFNGSTVFQTCGIVSGLSVSCRFGDYVNVELPYPHCCERQVICTKKYPKKFRHKQAVAAFVWLTFIGITQAQLLNSLNNYGDNTYPHRCVIDMGSSLVMLKYRESIKLENLPCTQILCMGDGWGLLQTCSHDLPPDDCRYSKFDWDAEYPKCCNRRIICD